GRDGRRAPLPRDVLPDEPGRVPGRHAGRDPDRPRGPGGVPRPRLARWRTARRHPVDLPLLARRPAAARRIPRQVLRLRRRHPGAPLRPGRDRRPQQRGVALLLRARREGDDPRPAERGPAAGLLPGGRPRGGERAVARDHVSRRAVRLAAPDRRGGRPGVPGVSTAGVLYVVATPIGNLEDVTLRALRVLAEVDVIAAEDTRRTAILVRHHGIRTRLVSYYDAVERRRTPELVERMRAGGRVALVTDAGAPGVADPGYPPRRGALEAGIPVGPVPGAPAGAAPGPRAGLPVRRLTIAASLP